MKYLTAFFLFFISIISFGQNNEVDLYIKTLNRSFDELIYKNPDSLLNLLKNTSQLSKEKKVNAWREFSLGKYYFFKRNLDSSLYHINRSIELQDGIEDPDLNFNSKIRLSDLYKVQRKYDLSIEILNQLEASLNDIKTDYNIKINLYRAIGEYYSEMNIDDKAIIYFLKAIKIIETNNLENSRTNANLFLKIGGVFKDINDYEKALVYSKKARQICNQINFQYGEETTNIKIFQILTSLNTVQTEDVDRVVKSIDYFKKNKVVSLVIEGQVIYAKYLYITKNYDDALEIYLNSLELSKSNNFDYGIINTNNRLGEIYVKKLNYKLATEHFKNAIKHAENSRGFNTSIIYSLSQLTSIYETQNNFKDAFINSKKLVQLKDSINASSKLKLTQELETKYQNKKKEQEISLLKSQNEIVEQQKKNQRNILLSTIGIATIAGLFLYFLYRNRQKTNTKLRELDALKSNFFANISHEFRTPLTLIASPIDDVLGDNTISDKNRQQFTVAKQNSDRLLELVNQLLDLSKIDAGHLKLHIQQGNVLQLISALSDSFSYHAMQKNITYTINVEQSEEKAWFDEDAIEKIAVNLLSNALKYTPENGIVTCHAYVENNKLFLEVKNTGKGLTKHELENIFERFYQTNDQNQGTGIGLALVRELVELHKGTIKVTSIPNKETSFKLSLSIDKNSFKNESIITPSTNEVQSEIPLYTNVAIEDDDQFTDSDLPILLIVEDNDDLRHLLKQTFEDRYNVISAPNGTIGVAQALEHIPDLIISDIMMPEKDGIALTKELKNDERTAHIPIILLTAKAEVESQFKGIDTGADDYITKPFDKKLLALKVEKLIESRRQLQLRYSQELVLLPKDIAITNLDEKFLEKVQEILDTNLVESSFNVTDFSEAAGMSRMQLHRKLKALTGLTATEFIRSQRLKLAAQLLKTSDINISQVGYSVGFNDHSYFAKCFKKAYNCTPTEFANRN